MIYSINTVRIWLPTIKTDYSLSMLMKYMNTKEYDSSVCIKSRHRKIDRFYKHFIDQRKRAHLPEMTNGLSFF